MSMRKLSDAFVADLKQGCLKPFVDRVKDDGTLLLCIRNGYINIYYRGGSLVRISEKPSATGYEIFFDKNYLKSGITVAFPEKTFIEMDADSVSWVEAFKFMKEAMDIHLSGKEALEREFQQLVVRENNYSRISNGTEYFFTDIEFSDSEISGPEPARFDLMGICWPASSRGNLSKCKPVMVEMKYGDEALRGVSGLEKHANNLKSVFGEAGNEIKLREIIQYQYNLLFDLGLIRVDKKGHIDLMNDLSPEVIFLLANTNPRGKKLRDELSMDYFDSLGKAVDLKFFVSSFSGYAMHTACMKSLEEFRRLNGVDFVAKPDNT